MLVPDLAGPGGERVKLLDFGIAKLGLEHLHGEDAKTRTGQVIGTAAYMSPEQFMATPSINGQSDVYSLGVVMYRLLCGKLPFDCANGQMAVGMMHLSTPPPPLTEHTQDLSEWLVKLVHRMLAKTANARPTMAQVTSELQENLPMRQSSSNLRPIARPEKDAPAQDPTETRDTAPAIIEIEMDSVGALATKLHDQGMNTVGGLPMEHRETVALQAPTEKGKSGAEAGSLTDATGQRASAGRKLRGRFVTYAALGFATLITSGGGFYLLTRSGLKMNGATSAALPTSTPVTISTAEPKAAGDASPVGEPAAKNPTVAAPGKVEKPEAAKNSGVPAEATEDNAKRKGIAKGSRLPSSTKPAERKNDDKPRRTSKQKPTPILD